MPALRRIAIVGGGPCGALAAAALARSGRDVLLFDEKLAWEKPCGGGLTEKALARWPFLREAHVERKWITDCELISPSGRTVRFHLDREIAIFSRKTLNGLLLDRARDSGACLIQERISKAERADGSWYLHSPAASYKADFVLLASGARNSLRPQFAPALGAENFMVAAGYFIPQPGNTVQIKFVQGLHGYMWIFPRANHLSAGICGRIRGKSTSELKAILEAWLRELGVSLAGAQLYAHVIPALSVSALRNQPIGGDGWAMAGDAAGFVDAITGEGIYYALQSAELVSSALIKDEPQQYPALVRADFLAELEHAARIANRFYSGTWLGASVIERMIRLTTQSDRFRDLMSDLFAGAQQYSSLRRRVHRSLPVIAMQALASTFQDGAGAGVRDTGSKPVAAGADSD
jgi:flavin-dependent dehydrogenase